MSVTPSHTRSYTIAQALAWASSPDQISRTDAEFLLMHVLQCSRSRLLTHADGVLSPAQSEHFERLVTRRQMGEPVAYLTGTRGFWTLDLMVTPAVLIPRPETELLVETVLAMAGNNAPVTLVDLGTGSGAIALAIASERPHWQVVATDASEAALRVANHNAQQAGLFQVRFLHGNWCEALPPKLTPDIIVSNPPYIAPDDPHLEQGDLRYEPVSALRSADNGLQDIRLISSQAAGLLSAGGWLLFEHGYQQAEAVREIMANAGFDQLQSLRDLNGHERVTRGVRA